MKCPSCQAENLSDSRFCHNCATPLKESTTKTIKAATFEVKRGDLFAGRYEIIEELGQGGMGKVFKVYDHKVSEVIALKLIRPEISVNDKAIDRFKNELKFARKISHRNVCRMHDLGEEGFFYYITMEYVPGEDLKRFIRRAGPLNTGKIVHIARQVSEGLGEAHHLGVIHRDLKPQNVMIDQDGNAKIMDFGIARFMDTERMTGTGVMVGTPEYMSPEQAELKEVDHRADIYSLGIILYEMATGRVPFEGQTPLRIAIKHKSYKAKHVRELNPQVPAGLANIIVKCMEKAPEMRYQSIQELIAGLNVIEQDLSTGERFVPKRPAESAQKKAGAPAVKKLIIPAAAVVLAVAAFLVIKIVPGKKIPSSSPAPDVQTAKQAGDVSVSQVRSDQPPVSKPAGDKKATQAAASFRPVSSEAVKKEDSGAGEKEKKKASPKAPSQAELQSASLALARVRTYKSQAQKAGIDPQTVFYRRAESTELQAKDYLNKNSVVEARSMFSISERLFRLCMEKEKDADRLKVWKKFVENLRKDVEKRKASVGEKAMASAGEQEKQAAAFEAKRDIENALNSYIQAAFGYEIILVSSQEKKTD
ncbi:MAG: serine/threonine-protein kinase [Acidobacteriota bacterium]